MFPHIYQFLSKGGGVVLIVLYSIGCTLCYELQKMLDGKNIKYDLFTNIDKMRKMGFLHYPILEVDGMLMDYDYALKWLEER